MTLDEARRFIADDHFATEQCGIRVESLDAHQVCVSMAITESHLNANKVVQGGAIYTLCDTAFAIAANAEGQRMVNRSAEITYLKPGMGTVLYAKTRCVSRGAMMGLYQVEVYDDQQKLIALMTINGFGRR